MNLPAMNTTTRIVVPDLDDTPQDYKGATQ
jgi:hypothetical protein